LAATTAKRMFDAWWEQAATVSAEQISSARERQDELAKTRGWDIDSERQPGHQPPPKPRPPATELPDATAAPAASPPAIVHFWTWKTIAGNQDRAGKPHDWFDSNHASAGHIQPGTRVYSVGGLRPAGSLSSMHLPSPMSRQKDPAFWCQGITQPHWCSTGF
jgi:hypothetical protein